MDEGFFNVENEFFDVYMEEEEEEGDEEEEEKDLFRFLRRIQ